MKKIGPPITHFQNWRGENIPEKSSKKGVGGGVTIEMRAIIEWEEKCVLEMTMMVLAR